VDLAAVKTLRTMERSGIRGCARRRKEIRAHQLGGLFIGGARRERAADGRGLCRGVEGGQRGPAPAGRQADGSISRRGRSMASSG
jgi:hypothetical protein